VNRARNLVSIVSGGHTSLRFPLPVQEAVIESDWIGWGDLRSWRSGDPGKPLTKRSECPTNDHGDQAMGFSSDYQCGLQRGQVALSDSLISVEEPL